MQFHPIFHGGKPGMLQCPLQQPVHPRTMQPLVIMSAFLLAEPFENCQHPGVSQRRQHCHGGLKIISIQRGMEF